MASPKKIDATPITQLLQLTAQYRLGSYALRTGFAHDARKLFLDELLQCDLRIALSPASRATAISTASDQCLPAKASLPPLPCHHAAMAGPRKAPRIQIVCGTCGSTDVSRDA